MSTVENIEERNGQVLLRVRVQPKASRNAIRMEPDGRIRVALTAPPVEGAANKALIQFIAKKMGIPKAGVTLLRGEKARDKTLGLAGVTAVQVRAIMEST